MQIRERRNVIQLIRTWYCPDKKRGVSMQIGSFPIESTECPDEIFSELTDIEKKEMTSYFSVKAKEEAIVGASRSLRLLPFTIQRASEAFDIIEDLELKEEDALSIYHEFDELAKKMRKLGFFRPKAGSTKTEDENQQE